MFADNYKKLEENGVTKFHSMEFVCNFASNKNVALLTIHITIMDSLRKFRIEQNALRIYIFACGIGMTIYCGLLCFGIRHCLAELTCLTGAYLLLCGGAWMYKVCPLSWAMVVYTYAIRVCIILQPEGVFDGECTFGSILTIAHHIAFTVGVILTVIFFNNIEQYKQLFEYEKQNI